VSTFSIKNKHAGKLAQFETRYTKQNSSFQ